MMKKILLFAFVLCLLCLIRCSDDSIKSKDLSGDDPHLTPADLTDTDKGLIKADNTFGFKLFKEVVREDKDENVFVSPLSVAMALGMTYNGAAGTTREQMQQVLELKGMTVEEVNQAYRNVIDVLTNLDDQVDFRIANSIWYRLGLPVEQTFLDLNQTYFDAEVTALDFTAPESPGIINGWVDEKTNGKITEIVGPQIPGNVAMMLIDAIYFKGNWSDQFNPDSTQTAVFTLADDTQKECQMMRKHTAFNYAWQPQFQIIDLPYGDSAFSMTIIFPAEGVDIDAIIGEFNNDTWADWLGSLHKQEITLGLPKFKLEYEISLVDVLKILGMTEAFAPGADFSGMVKDHALWIDEVKHKTFVEVNEEGTEAAAVTVVIIVDSLPPWLEINRPFILVIHDSETGTILFMGKIVDPT
ncbi:MAG: serpin family protein [Candidatus Zixiibacteriota bacterium]|nr:MAG: serpin family protein [candidate division Zixibacteria bacterium]